MDTTPTCPSCGKPLAPSAPKGLCQECLLKAGFPSGTQSDPGGAAQAGVSSFVPPAPEELAAKFPQLQILELLGRGGMGVVYKARQKSLNRLVALKILAPERERDAAFARRFAVEAETLARLSHPNIVTIHDFGQADGLFYLVMEFVDGVSLGQLLKAGRVAPREALAIVPQVCDALQFAHDHGIVHRDIKPENVLLDRRGRVKVADFGLAKLIGEDPSSSLSPSEGERAGERGALTEGKIMGTPSYMAPEQAEHPAEVDHRADIYALGVVFYQMLTGELPDKKLEPPSKKVQVDVRLDEVVLRALEKEPERRYQQASQLKTQVETIATSAAPQSGRSRREECPTEELQIKNQKSKIDQGPLTPPPTGSRLSRTAIAGAAWAPFFFLAAILAFSTMTVVTVPAGMPPPGPAWWQILLMFTLLPLGIAAPFGTTILGWIAVSQINRSAGRLYGRGLAVADGLLFPLLVLDSLIGAFLGSGLAPAIERWCMVHGGHEVYNLAGWFLALLGVSTCAAADVWIVRRVWLGVIRPAQNASRLAPGTARMWWLAAGACGLVFMATLVLLANLIPGPAGTASAEFRYRVFETDADFADHLIPVESRQPGVMAAVKPLLPDAQVSAVSTNGVFTKTDSQMSLIPQERLVALLDGAAEDPGLLADERRTINWWPNVAAGWGYARRSTAGGGQGSLGVRQKKGRRQVRIEFRVDHRVRSAGGQPVLSKILYEGTAPRDGALAFLVPFQRTDDPPRYLVIAFEIGAGQMAGAQTQNSAQAVRRRLETPVEGDFKPPRTSSGTNFFGNEEEAAAESKLRLGLESGADSSGTKRQRFEPKKGMAGQTSWGVIPRPSDLNPNGWTLMTRMSLGGVAPVTLPGEKEPICKLELVKGNDDQITLQIEDLKANNTLTMTLGRDQPAEILVNGKGYRVRYTSVYVNPDQPDTWPFAQVIMIPVDARGDAGKSFRNAEPGGGKKLSFGPVIERVVSDGDRKRDCLIDLDTGKIFTAPDDLAPRVSAESQDAVDIAAAFTWLTDHGIDAMAEPGKGVEGLIGFSLRASPVAKGMWDQATPEDVRALISKQTDEAARRIVLSGSGGLPKTFAFQTREGGRGILQITAITENPRGVKLRYKLVENRNGASDAHSATPVMIKGTDFSITSQDGQVIIDSSNGRMSADKLKLSINSDRELMVTCDEITFFQIQTNASTVQSAQQPNFGPVIERVIEEAVAPRYPWFDLDTGKSLASSDTFPSGSEIADEAVAAWRAKSGAEVAANLSEGFCKLIGFDMIALPVTDDQWDRIAPSDLAVLLSVSKPSSPAVMSSKDASPATYAFKTREGGKGVLQLTGLSDHPRGVKIRYKLVQSSKPAEPAQESPSSIIYVHEDGKIFLDSDPVELEKLRDVLKDKTQANPSFKVSLKADTKAPFDVVAKVTDAIRNAGITATTPPPKMAPVQEIRNTPVQEWFDRIAGEYSRTSGPFVAMWALIAKAKQGGAVRDEITRTAIQIIDEPIEEDVKRWQCCYVLSGIGDKRGIPALKRALHDKNEVVRGVAACALGSFDDSDAGSALADAAQNEKAPAVLDWIRKALDGQFRQKDDETK